MCVCVVSDLCNDVWYGVVHDIITNWTRGQGGKDVNSINLFMC